MKFISCASYFGTGSSAITDYVSEFENVHSFTDYEFRFLQDPDGISDLEYNLIENHNRHNSGYALKKYKKLVDYFSGNFFVKRYEPFFNNQWRVISYRYIDELTDLTYKGYWYYDVKDKGLLFLLLVRLINKILQKTIWINKDISNLNELPNEKTLCSYPNKERFLKSTKNYIEELFAIANYDNKPFLMVDQIVPPSNINRFLRYFDDIHVFIVDRDPRDLFLLAKYDWKIHIIPTENADVFCEWYRYTRAHRKNEKFDIDKVLFIQFEDMIYKYEETTNKINDFLGLSKNQHTSPKQYFNPDKSAKNTKVWLRDSGYQKEAFQIAEALPEYLYDFEG